LFDLARENKNFLAFQANNFEFMEISATFAALKPIP
jgi:hypothetical protein